MWTSIPTLPHSPKLLMLLRWEFVTLSTKMTVVSAVTMFPIRVIVFPVLALVAVIREVGSKKVRK